MNDLGESLYSFHLNSHYKQESLKLMLFKLMVSSPISLFTALKL